MHVALNKTLSALPDDTIVYCGVRRIRLRFYIFRVLIDAPLLARIHQGERVCPLFDGSLPYW